MIIKNKVDNMKEKYFNVGTLKKEELEQRIKEVFKTVEDNIRFLELEAEKRDVYIRINKDYEKEKALKKEYPFLNLVGYNKLVGSVTQTARFIMECYEQRIKKALQEIGFKDYNEKNDTIKLNTHNGLKPQLHYLEYVTSFKGDYEVVKEYKNGNVIIRLLDDNDREAFKKVINWANEATIRVINETPQEIIKEYKKKKKEKHYNEYYVIYDYWENKGLNMRCGVNWYLINKEWGIKNS